MAAEFYLIQRIKRTDILPKNIYCLGGKYFQGYSCFSMLFLMLLQALFVVLSLLVSMPKRKTTDDGVAKASILPMKFISFVLHHEGAATTAWVAEDAYIPKACPSLSISCSYFSL